MYCNRIRECSPLISRPGSTTYRRILKFSGQIFYSGIAYVILFSGMGNWKIGFDIGASMEITGSLCHERLQGSIELCSHVKFSNFVYQYILLCWSYLIHVILLFVLRYTRYEFTLRRTVVGTVLLYLLHGKPRSRTRVDCGVWTFVPHFAPQLSRELESYGVAISSLHSMVTLLIREHKVSRPLTRELRSTLTDSIGWQWILPTLLIA